MIIDEKELQPPPPQEIISSVNYHTCLTTYMNATKLGIKV